MNKRQIVITGLVLLVLSAGIATADFTIEDDFEDGNVDGWSGTDVQVTTTDVIEGTYSAELTGGGSVETTFSLAQTNQPQYSFWLRMPDGSGTNSASLWELNGQSGAIGDSGTATAIQISMDAGVSDTDIELNNGDIYTSPTLGEWYRFEITNIDYSADTFDIDVYNSAGDNVVSLDGRSFSDGTGISHVGGRYDNSKFAWDYIVSDGTADITQRVVTGTVNNTRTGNAVENANVRVFETDGTLVTSTTTDSNGDYSLAVDDGQYFFDYNKGTAYIDRQILNTVSSDETINVDLQPRRVVYTDASPRANEYIRNRTTTAFDLSINVSDPSGNQVTTKIFWFNESTNDFENIHQVTNWADSTSIDIEFPTDANKGLNTWFASTETGRGTFNSSANSPTNGYQFETPGNISIRDTPDPSTTLTDAEITATIIGLSSGFQETRTTTSTGAGTWDGEIDLNDIPKEDYRITLESTDGTKYRDAILGLNADRVTDLNIAIMVDDNTFTTEDGWYAQEFQLNDNTGAWSPENVMLFLQQNVDGSYQEVGGDLFGTQNSAVIDVNDTTEYRLLLYHLQRGDSRSVGTFKADRDLSTEVVTINVDSVAPPPTEDNDEGYEILAFLLNVESSDPSLRVTFSDPEELTYEFNFQIYERGNQTNVLVPDDGAAHLGNATFTYDVSVNQTRTSWVVDWNATRDGELINGTLVVTGERLDPGIPVNTNARHGVAFLSILLVGGVVGGGARSDLGAVVVALMGGFFVFIGWMPSVVGMSVIVFALFVAILFNARIRGQTP